MNRLISPLLTTTAALLLAVSCVPAARADVKLPALLSPGAVLQQKVPVRVYGTADPSEAVTVVFRDQTLHATAGADRTWQVVLKPLAAGGPDDLTVRGKNTVTVGDVLVGEVWICSGQSNMEFHLDRASNAAPEIARSADPRLRMFTVARTVAVAPLTEVSGGTWQSASPATSGDFSAVGYYFAKALRAARGVPIGMIHSSWGGTRIEAWTSRAVLLAGGMPASVLAPVDKTTPAFQAAQVRYDDALAAWKAAGSPRGAVDTGRDPKTADWAASDWDDSSWGKFTNPGYWEQSGIPEMANLDGGVWFRRVVEVAGDPGGRAATLSLGTVDDRDTTFVNGVRVGVTGEETPSSWTVPRVYPIPSGVLKMGKNVVAVRVWDTSGMGGMTGPAPDMFLRFADDGGTTTRLPLSGAWRYKIEKAVPSDPGGPPDANDPNTPSVLYNGMIAPLTRYTIKGAIWYQGESNTDRPFAYRKQMPDMIQNWRDAFGIKNFPFFMVQLAPNMALNDKPEDTDWARLREAQLVSTYALPNVGMAVITDVGDAGNIHPTRKGPVGERLALLARRTAYGEKIVDKGPVYKEVHIEGDHALLTFDSTGTGLVAHSRDSADRPVPQGKLVGFTVAGADGKFVWADARITGKDTITVSAPSVPHPLSVRFGWANFPVVNLYNAEGLPATPFRTNIK